MAVKKPAPPSPAYNFVPPAQGQNVGVLCLCVPDGIVPDSGGEKVRLSLSLLPEHEARSGYGATLKLQAWPGYFSRKDFGFALYVVDELTKTATRVGDKLFRDPE